MIIDGNAMSYSTIYQPKGYKVNKLVESVSVYIFSNLKKSDVYLIFDRYQEYIINQKQEKREGTFIKEYTFTETTPLPGREVALGCTKNKVPLIELIPKGLL